MNIAQLSKPHISKKIPPNYSAWQTIEYSNQCAKYVLGKRIEGVFVECGVASGNNLAAMCYAGGHGHGFDSFEGIPWAGKNDLEQPGIGEVDKSKIGLLESSGITVHNEAGVHENFRKWGLSNYTLHKGWFQDTVQHFSQPISVLRLDGDLYESTLVCLEHLYPLLTRGGILIIDDWNLAGCVKAFNKYFKKDKPKEFHYEFNNKYFINV